MDFGNFGNFGNPDSNNDVKSLLSFLFYPPPKQSIRDTHNFVIHRRVEKVFTIMYDLYWQRNEYSENQIILWISTEIYILSAKRKGKGNQIQILFPINSMNNKMQERSRKQQYKIIGMIKMDRLHSFVKCSGVAEFNYCVLSLKSIVLLK